MTIDERVSSELKRHLPDVDERGVWRRIQTAAVAARRRRIVLMAAASVASVIVVTVGWIGLSGVDRSLLPVASNPTRDVPVENLATIRQLVAAVNTRDAAAFIGAFAADGYFNPHGEFHESSLPFGQHQPVSQVPLVEAWMSIIDAWGFEAGLLDCSRLTEIEVAGLRGNWGWPRSGPGASVIQCEVATRWQRLSLEITEGWVYEFRGSQLDNWGFVLLDLNPPERTLPLGYDGLEAWEAWLEANHPEATDRLLNRHSGECNDDCEKWRAELAPSDPELAARLARLLDAAEKEWSVDGHDFTPGGLVPYDPALADEIEASIREYLNTR